MTPEKVLDAASWSGRQGVSSWAASTKRVCLVRHAGLRPEHSRRADRRTVRHQQAGLQRRIREREIGQVGTQFDGFGHIGIQVETTATAPEKRYYNGFSEHEIASSYGMKKLGIEHVKPFVTRGHLVDIAGLKGGMLNQGEEITMADVRAALSRRGCEEDDIQPGRRHPVSHRLGPALDEGQREVQRRRARHRARGGALGRRARPMLTGATPRRSRSCQTRIHTGLPGPRRARDEERDLQPREPRLRRAAGRSELPVMYVFVPVPIKGATGSPGSPIAITSMGSLGYAQRQDPLTRFSHAIGNFVPDAISASVILLAVVVAAALAIGNPACDGCGCLLPRTVDAPAVHHADDADPGAQRGGEQHAAVPGAAVVALADWPDDARVRSCHWLWGSAPRWCTFLHGSRCLGAGTHHRDPLQRRRRAEEDPGRLPVPPGGRVGGHTASGSSGCPRLPRS